MKAVGPQCAIYNQPVDVWPVIRLLFLLLLFRLGFLRHGFCTVEDSVMVMVVLLYGRSSFLVFVISLFDRFAKNRALLVARVTVNREVLFVVTVSKT